MISSAPGRVCGNCGTPLLGTYCHACGQEDRERLAALPDFLREAVHDMADVESRLLGTLRALLFKPGHLTTEYLRGRRASYVSPIRLYLLTSVAFAAAGVFSESSLQLTVEGATPDRGQWLRLWVWSVLVMMPVMAGLLKLTVGRGRFFTEGLVFALHLHAWVFLVNAVALPLIEVSPSEPLDILVVVSLPLLVVSYMAASMRRVYGTALLKGWALSVLLSVAYLGIQLVALGGAGRLADFLGAA